MIPGFANNFSARTFCYICCSFSLITDSSSGPQNNQEVRNSGPKCALSVRQCQGGACALDRDHTHSHRCWTLGWLLCLIWNMIILSTSHITHHTTQHVQLQDPVWPRRSATKKNHVTVTVKSARRGEVVSCHQNWFSPRYTVVTVQTRHRHREHLVCNFTVLDASLPMSHIL